MATAGVEPTTTRKISPARVVTGTITIVSPSAMSSHVYQICVITDPCTLIFIAGPYANKTLKTTGSYFIYNSGLLYVIFIRTTFLEAR